MGMQEMVTHYLPKRDLSIHWPKDERGASTVIEFNTWEGREEPDDARLAPRRCVVMETAHDAIINVCELLKKGDEKTLEALALATFPPEGTTGVLGYDFVRREPRVLLYVT